LYHQINRLKVKVEENNPMKIQLILLLVGSLFAFSVCAQTPEEKGLAIAKSVEKADEGWGDSTANLNMVLRNRQGEESVRAIRLKSLEVQGDGDKSMSIFDSPRDVKGTAFLSFSHAIKPDDQWLYLPALKRVKRISSSNKSGPFMGSQFSYEDLASFEVEKYNYKYIRDEAHNGINTSVVENYPNYKHSGYKRQIVWLDMDRKIPLKVEYYDRKNDLLKVLTFSDYQQYKGKFWRAHTQSMINKQNGKSTLITMSDFKFDTGLRDKDFSKNALKRAR